MNNVSSIYGTIGYPIVTNEWFLIGFNPPTKHSSDPSGYVEVKKGKRIEKRKWNMVENSEFTHWRPIKRKKK